MKERPILFSGAMVRSLLAGTKTQTRRVVKPQPTHFNPVGVPRRADPNASSAYITCPYGQPGSQMWVREAFRFTDPFDADSPSRVGMRCLDAGYKKPWAPVQFEADKAQQNWVDVGTPAFPQKEITAGKLRPGMFMPRWASRILLEVTEVRVERLQDISEADAEAEGARRFLDVPMGTPSATPCRWSMETPASTDECLSTARWAFANYFCKVNSKGRGGAIDSTSWDANPWVWAVSFKVLEK